MKWSLLIFMVLVAVSGSAQSLRQILLQADSSLKDVRIIPCKASPELFIAILVAENHWWESIRFIKYKQKRIVWGAVIDSLPDAQSIYAARQIFLKGFPDPMIEVFDMTHMGNGCYYLYRLHGRHAKLMVKTRAIDRSMDGAEKFGDSMDCSRVFKNDSLTPSYTDINHDGYADISLAGIELLYAQDDKTLLRHWSVRQVFLYNKRRHRFIEDRRRCRGISEL